MKITKLLSIALVAAVLGLAACSKSSDDSNNNDANQTTLLTASASLAASVNIFPSDLNPNDLATATPYATLAQDQFGAAVAGSGSFQFSTVFSLPASLLLYGAGTPVSEINSSVIQNNSLLPTITGAGKPYTVFFTVDLTSTLGVTTSTGGDSTLNVAAQVYQSTHSYLLEVLLPTDGTKTSSTWVALLAASEKKDQSEGSLVGFSSSFTTPATKFSWTRNGTTVTYNATVSVSGNTTQFSTAGIELTTTVAQDATSGLYTTTAGSLTVPAGVLNPDAAAAPAIVITWKADGTGTWSDGGQLLTGGQGGVSGEF
jgi:hypothetical protein